MIFKILFLVVFIWVCMVVFDKSKYDHSSEDQENNINDYLFK
jgi:hypothetical protein